MSRRTLTTMLAASLLVGLLASVHVPVAAALTFSACPNSTGLTCATLPVTLDRSGLTPGRSALSVERKAAAATQTQSAVLALAGGPGQAADPLSEQLAKAIAPGRSNSYLRVFGHARTGPP